MVYSRLRIVSIVLACWGMWLVVGCQQSEPEPPAGALPSEAALASLGDQPRPAQVARTLMLAMQDRLNAGKNDRVRCRRANEVMTRLAAEQIIRQRLARRYPDSAKAARMEDQAVRRMIEYWLAIGAFYANGFDLDHISVHPEPLPESSLVATGFVPVHNSVQDRSATVQVEMVREENQWKVASIRFAPVPNDESSSFQPGGVGTPQSAPSSSPMIENQMTEPDEPWR